MPPNTDPQPPPPRRRTILILALVLAAAVMGLPTLRGGFVGGDDHRLVLNHVFVNHPSLAHALRLFTIVHRDLYQPLPLLTFSGEFAVANVLRLFDSGVEGGAWLFHLTNVLLHAFNTVLVWITVGMLQRRLGVQRLAVATVAALLFAVHPFQVEVVAWVNGRMMLLSTLFALASLLAFARWLDARRPSYAVLTILFVLLSSLSKVRVGLPLLLGFVALIHGQRLRTRFWSVWILCALVTGWFVRVNIDATAGADLFAEGAEHLRGPVLVRVLLALAFYFQHLVWPVGLTSYYPTPPEVHWSDATTGVAAMTVALSLAILASFCRISRPCRWSVLWFFIAIADTLPFVPARNVLAADRYMYLPIIGLFWCLATVGYDAYSRWTSRSSSMPPRWIVASAAAILLPAMIGQSWFTAKWYNTALLKTQRVAECFPDEPRVWEKVGWSHYQAGRYVEALDCAQKELRFDTPRVQSGAYQLMGACQLKLGHGDEALRLIRRAMEVDPNDDLALYRLAAAYDDLGRFDDALPYYEAAAKAAPMNNPTLHRLAAVYRRMGRDADARAAYEQELANNPYEIPAVLALVELDNQTATRDAYLHAERLLVDLLRDVPDNAPARINLGVVRYALGKVDEAIDAYAEVLSRDPKEATAAINLAQLALAGDATQARRIAPALSAAADTVPLATAALAYAALAEGRYEEAGLRIQSLSLRSSGQASRDQDAAQARQLFLAALERYDQQHPDVPWTIALAADVLIADGQLDAARAFTDLFEARCDNPACRDRVRSLRQRLSSSRPFAPEPSSGGP
ncbi:MAG: tetratricopeptide repeat protein [Planctomycetota bacterium]